MPCALDIIRKLGQEGHEVIATDTFRFAPGSHSRYATAWRKTASPRYQRAKFIRDVVEIVEHERVDWVLPSFEESFYLAWHIDAVAPHARLFAPPFETLRRLHNKVETERLARELSIATPRTEVARDRAELVAATRRIDPFFARPAYSRGGVDLLTNTGPLAGALRVEDCEPTAENPWIVQEYVAGVDVCSFSVAHRGRLTGHSTYVHPREIEHAGGIVFESILDPETLFVARAVAEAVGYDGQISFDFKRTDRGLVLIECNARPTAGVFMMSSDMFLDALLDRRPGETLVAPEGRRLKISSALIRDMLLHWKDAPADLSALLSDARDVYAVPGDVAPALYQVLSYSHVMGYRLKARVRNRAATDLMAAYFYDICYNGEPLG